MHNLSLLESEQFDVLVIGGGVTGAGVALDAVARAYNVALVEKVDFASGTSSKSTKLVHGGIRYLPESDFALVREALVERGTLLRNAPYLVEPVGFVLPLYKGDRHPVGIPFTTPGGIGLGLILDIGLWFYDLMAGAVAGRRGVKMSARKRIYKIFFILRKNLPTKRSRNSRRYGNHTQASSISIYSLLNWINKGSSRKHKKEMCLAREGASSALEHRSRVGNLAGEQWVIGIHVQAIWLKHAIQVRQDMRAIVLGSAVRVKGSLIGEFMVDEETTRICPRTIHMGHDNPRFFFCLFYMIEQDADDFQLAPRIDKKC